MTLQIAYRRDYGSSTDGLHKMGLGLKTCRFWSATAPVPGGAATPGEGEGESEREGGRERKSVCERERKRGRECEGERERHIETGRECGRETVREGVCV